MRFLEQHYFVNEEEYERYFDEVEVLEEGRFVTRTELKPAVFMSAYGKVDKTKTPGSPMVYLAPLNSQLDGWIAEIYSSVDFRLRAMEEIGNQIWHDLTFESDQVHHINASCELVERGISDPVLVGFKGEPRKKGKTPRLVAQVSVVMNILARIVLGNHLIEEQTHTDIPTATQLDLTTPEETEKLRQAFLAVGVLRSSDVQGWEYSMNEGDRWCAAFKEAYCMGLVNTDWKIIPGKEKHFYALLGYHYCMIHRVVQLPEGELWVPPAGEMSSGELGTFSENSFVRAFLSENVSLDATGLPVGFVKTGGDDCLDTNADHSADYLRYGKVITDFSEDFDTYHFCSTTFAPSGSYQDNIGKSAYAACVKRKFDEQDRAAFRQNFKFHPQYEVYLALIEEFMSTLDVPQSAPLTLRDSVMSPVCFQAIPSPLEISSIKSMQNAQRQQTGQLVAYQQTPSRRRAGGRRRVGPAPNPSSYYGNGDYFSDFRAAARAAVDAAKAAQAFKAATSSIRSRPKAAAKAIAAKAFRSFTGSGDYHSIGSERVVNSLIDPVPGSVTGAEFYHMGRRGVVIHEREYIRDVRTGPTMLPDGGGTAFNNEVENLNPTNERLFPWLSQLANKWDQWLPLQIVFTYNTTSSTFNGATQALGSVVAAMDYDPADEPYSNKTEMAGADYAVSTVASISMEAGVECSRVEKPTNLLFTGPFKEGASKVSRNFYDLGTFQLATQGMSAPNVTVGELWVEYTIVFFKKQVPPPSAIQLLQNFATLTSTTPVVAGESMSSHVTKFAAFPDDFATNEGAQGIRLHLPGRYQVTLTVSDASWADFVPSTLIREASMINCFIDTEDYNELSSWTLTGSEYVCSATLTATANWATFALADAPDGAGGKRVININLINTDQHFDPTFLP